MRLKFPSHQDRYRKLDRRRFEKAEFRYPFDPEMVDRSINHVCSGAVILIGRW